MADTPASTTGTSHDFDLSSDEEDDILQNLKQQAQRGTRSSASYDPDASSNFGKTTASSEGTPNFESMRDAFREAGMEALETKSPVAAPPTVASADESIRVDFGQAAQRQSLAHQSIASVDGVMLLDPSTVANLELVRNLRTGDPHQSLFGALNQCITSAGAESWRRTSLKSKSMSRMVCFRSRRFTNSRRCRPGVGSV